MRLNEFFRRLWPFRQREPAESETPRTLAVLLDGTMSSLAPGCETNIGLTYRLMSELPSDDLALYYEPGIQWRGLLRAHEVMAGVGINRQIRRCYLFLARNYRPGDRIVLMGFSRGAYAARSLAGLIDKLGLLQPENVTEEALDRVYELYRGDPDGAEAAALREALCHPKTEIAFLGVFDTVRALGIRWPIIWRFMGEPHPYHNHALGNCTRVGRQALALQETRDAYEPVLWDVPQERWGEVVQMWFRGTHGDVGGHLGGRAPSRPLSNVPLVWMLEEAEAAGVPLVPGWRDRYPLDAAAPSIGPIAGWSKLFWDRSRRKTGQETSVAFHLATGR